VSYIGWVKYWQGTRRGDFEKEVEDIRIWRQGKRNSKVWIWQIFNLALKISPGFILIKLSFHLSNSTNTVIQKSPVFLFFIIKPQATFFLHKEHPFPIHLLFIEIMKEILIYLYWKELLCKKHFQGEYSCRKIKRERVCKKG